MRSELRGSRPDLETREPVEQPDGTRGRTSPGAGRVEEELSSMSVGRDEEGIDGERQPGEALDAARRFDGEVKPEPQPQREDARPSRPETDGEEELRRDGQRGERGGHAASATCAPRASAGTPASRARGRRAGSARAARGRRASPGRAAWTRPRRGRRWTPGARRGAPPRGDRRVARRHGRRKLRSHGAKERSAA